MLTSRGWIARVIGTGIIIVAVDECARDAGSLVALVVLCAEVAVLAGSPIRARFGYAFFEFVAARALKAGVRDRAILKCVWVTDPIVTLLG